MRKNYFMLWSLMAVAFLVFAAASFMAPQLKQAGIKTASFAQTLLGYNPHPVAEPEPEAEAEEPAPQPKPVKKVVRKVKVAKASAPQQPTVAQPVVNQPQPAAPAAPQATANSWRAPLDTAKKSILFIGDSMLEGLGKRLAQYAAYNGHKLNVVIWYSSSTEIWGRSGKLSQYVEQYNPDYVIVCLGANELFVRNIKEQRSQWVKKILRQAGERPLIWIGPPNWKNDTGVNDMIAGIVPRGCFYLSYTPDQHYVRGRDGAHPTMASAAEWTDRVCHWIVTKSAHPIRLAVPPKGTKGRSHVEILQPVR